MFIFLFFLFLPCKAGNRVELMKPGVETGLRPSPLLGLGPLVLPALRALLPLRGRELPLGRVDGGQVRLLPREARYLGDR